MSTEKEFCPNCNTELKEKFLTVNKLINVDMTAIINEYHSPKSEGYCNKCGGDLYSKYKELLKKEKAEITEKLEELISIIPVISTPSPLGWDYEVLDMVTGQSTMGTGAITEFTSTITDFLGTQSSRHNKKLKLGENLCFAQLRKQTIDLGGNAVIASDIKYTELGALKGMIMVCMNGTAIKLKNSEILGDKKSSKIDSLVQLNDRLTTLLEYKIIMEEI